MRRFILVFTCLAAACSDSTTATAPTSSSSSGGNGSSSGGPTTADGGVVVTADGGPILLPDGGVDPFACPNGGTLIADKVSCAATAPSVTLATGAPGDIVSLAGFNPPDAPCLPVHVCSATNAATLIFSDSPETPSTSGVLYADTLVAGTYRFYVYHANGDTAVRKFPVVVLNQGAADAQVTINRRGIAPPSTAYVGQGKAVLADWLGDSRSTVVTIPAGQRVLLDPDLDALHATQNQLVHAIYDVTTTASLKVSIVSVTADADAAAATAGLTLLPRQSTHQRGTFPNADIVLVPTIATLDGARRLRLGSDDVDPARMGIDATTGDAQQLAGNFGVSYRLALGGLPNAKLAISPRGGAWAGAALHGTDTSSLPSAQESLATTTDAIVLGTSDAADITLGTGGGSSLPIDLIFGP